MAFKEGTRHTTGRPKGAINKLTAQKQAFCNTFYASGGQARLVEECRDRDVFLMVARWVVGLLPKDIKVDTDGGLTVNLTLPRPSNELLEGEVVDAVTQAPKCIDDKGLAQPSDNKGYVNLAKGEGKEGSSKENKKNA